MLAIFWPLFLLLLPAIADSSCTAGQFYTLQSPTTCLSCPAGTYCPFSVGCPSNCTQCPSRSGSAAGLYPIFYGFLFFWYMMIIAQKACI